MTAIYLALAYADRPYVDLIAQICALGGDADTIAAMAGAIWGARNGRSELDKAMVEQTEDAGRIADLAQELHVRCASDR